MSLTAATQAAIDAQPGEFIDWSRVPWHLRLWFDLCVWWYGSFKPQTRLSPWRRWCVNMAFFHRFEGNDSASNFYWRLSRLFAVERTHIALAAYTTKMLMGAIQEGRE